jgi:hypothetical protein
MLKRIHVKYPLLLQDFNKTLIFDTDFRNKFKYISSKSVQWELSFMPLTETDGRTNMTISSKSVQWELSFMPLTETDGRTNMTKLVVAFCNFENAPKN